MKEKWLEYNLPNHRSFYDKIKDMYMHMQLQECFNSFGLNESIKESIHLLEKNERKINQAIDRQVQNLSCQAHK